MDIKDRGLMKWQGFFMPEHVSSLKGIWHDDKKEDKPILDEYQLREMDEKIHTAMEFRLPLIFTLWFDGFFEEIEGVLHYIDSVQNKLRIVDIKGDVQILDHDSVVGVEFLE